MIMKGGVKVKFYMYGRTPRGKTPKWITVVLISFFVCLAAVFFMVGIVISIDIQSIFPILIVFFSIISFPGEKCKKNHQLSAFSTKDGFYRQIG